LNNRDNWLSIAKIGGLSNCLGDQLIGPIS
jgi:hypothetical protein